MISAKRLAGLLALVLLAARAALAGTGPTTRVACVGDSITFGSTLRDVEHDSYPAQLARLLGPRWEVRNFGVSGATLLKKGNKPYTNEKAYGQALEFKPDVVVIKLGTNDSKHPGDGVPDSETSPDNWRHKDEFVADYKQLVDAFRNANPQVKVYVCTPVPAITGRWGINGKAIHEEVLPLVKRAATELGANLIDLHAALDGKAELFPDTIHPNAKGAGLIARAVYKSIADCDPPAISEPLTLLLTNRRVLWLGDSITQDGRYVSLVEYYLNKKFSNVRFDIVSIGLSSETVSGLSEKSHPFPRPCVLDRLQSALEKVKPATVVACYGMNDGIYAPKSEERALAFQDGMRSLLRTCKLARTEVILITPPMFDVQPVRSKARPLTASADDFGSSTPFEGYDDVLSDFAAWETKLAPGDARVVIDLHTAMKDYVTKRRATQPDFSFTSDGIHPSSAGHLLMARTFLESIGVPLDPIDDLDKELERVKADPMLKLIIERREKRSDAWRTFVAGQSTAASVNETEKSVAELQAQIDRLRRVP